MKRWPKRLAPAPAPTPSPPPTWGDVLLGLAALGMFWSLVGALAVVVGVVLRGLLK